MPPSLSVLVVDDEPQIRRLLQNALADDFARVIEASDGVTALDLAAAARPSLVILDLGLPDMDGAAVCRALRAWSDMPIIVLSARHAESEKVALLDAGADDYVTKPFGTDEFRARVRAVLRRRVGSEGEEQEIAFGPYAMDLVGRVLRRQGEIVHLTPIEWELLRVLVTHAGKTLTHQQIFTLVWPSRRFGDAQQYLRFHIANLRRKIEDDALAPRYVITEPGVGYRFAGE